MRIRLLAVSAMGAALFAGVGCGGGGGAASDSTVAPPAPANTPTKVGRVRVNVESGQFEYQPISSDGRALTLGSGLNVEAITLKFDGGERSRYVAGLEATLKNFNGLSEKPRLILEDVTAGTTLAGDDRPFYKVSTFAGLPGVSGSASGPRGVGSLASPRHVEIMNADIGGTELAVATSTRIAKISRIGGISYLYTAPAGATITDIAVDSSDNIWATLSNHTLAKIGSDTGAVSVTGVAGATGHIAGTGTTARFTNPRTVTPTFVVDDNGFRPLTTTTGSIALASFVPPSNMLESKLIAQTSTGLNATWGGTHIGSQPSSNRVTVFNSTSSGRPTLGTGTLGSANGLGDVAQFRAPTGVTQLGRRVFVTDKDNHSIRNINNLANGLEATPKGFFVSTVAGTGVSGFQDGLGTVARFNSPEGICQVEALGTIYVADTLNHVIRKVERNAVWPTLSEAGGTVSSQPVGFPGAKFLPNPNGDANPYWDVETINGYRVSTEFIFVLPEGTNTFEADVVLMGTPFYTGALQAVLNAPGTDVQGSPRTGVRTIAGRFGPGGYADGDSIGAIFGGGASVAYDGNEVLFVGDAANGVIRRRDTSGVYKTIIGDPFNPSTLPVNGTGAAEAGVPTDIAVSTDGKTLWWTDSVNHVVRRAVYNSEAGLTESNPAAWNVTTLYGLAGTQGDAAGVGTTARLRNPAGIAYDPNTRLVYIADRGNHRIKRFSSEIAGPLLSFAGNGASGSLNGFGGSASFNSPNDVGVSPLGDVFVADTLNRTIRKITPNGEVSLLAGVAGAGFLQDGLSGAASRFNTPTALAVDQTGYVFVVDQRVSHVIRRVSPLGETKTTAGNSLGSLASDGPGSTAVFPLGSMSLAVTKGNELTVANGVTIREVQGAFDTETEVP